MFAIIRCSSALSIARTMAARAAGERSPDSMYSFARVLKIARTVTTAAGDLITKRVCARGQAG
jgi:hypothetical protein